MNKKKNLIMILGGILIAILLFFVSLSVYNKYFKLTVLNNDNQLVTMLYGCFENENNTLMDSVLEKVNFNSNDLSENQKYFLAFNSLQSKKLQTDICRNYPKLSGLKLYKEGIAQCGIAEIDLKGEQYDDTLYPTTVFKDDDLKIKFEQLFGKNTYETIDTIHIDAYTKFYKYDDNSRKYVLMQTPGVGGMSEKRIKTMLKKATKKGDIITLEIQLNTIEVNKDDKIETVHFIFELEDSNYIFKEAKKAN